MMKRSIAMLLITGMMLFSLPAISFASGNDASPTTEATEENSSLTDPGITPDSWLYGLDQFIKDLHLIMTFDTAKKAGLLREISEERLAEAKQMVDENKAQYGLIAMEAYSDSLKKAVELLDEAIIEEKDVTDVIDEFSSTLANRLDLIRLIIDQLPEETKTKIHESLEQAINNIIITINIFKDDKIGDEEDAGWNYEIIVSDIIDEDAADGEDTKDEENTSKAEEPDDEKPENEDITESEEPGEEKPEDEDITENEELDDEKPDDPDPTDSKMTVKLPLKKVITAEIFEKEIAEEAAKLYALGQLNVRQILSIYSLAEQTEKSFAEVLEVFLQNGKGIGATAKALGLAPKNALKGIKGVYKDIKNQIKDGFKAAKKGLIELGGKETAEELENIPGEESVDDTLNQNKENPDKKDDRNYIDGDQDNRDRDDEEPVDENDDDKYEVSVIIDDEGDKDSNINNDEKKSEKNKIKEKDNKKNDKTIPAKSHTSKKNNNPNARFNRK